MSVSNFYEKIPKVYLVKAENPNYDVHQIKIPARIVVSAPSGTGKTNFVMNFIQHFCAGKGTFADILVLTKMKYPSKKQLIGLLVIMIKLTK